MKCSFIMLFIISPAYTEFLGISSSYSTIKVKGFKVCNTVERMGETPYKTFQARAIIKQELILKPIFS